MPESHFARVENSWKPVLQIKKRHSFAPRRGSNESAESVGESNVVIVLAIMNLGFLAIDLCLGVPIDHSAGDFDARSVMLLTEKPDAAARPGI